MTNGKAALIPERMVRGPLVYERFGADHAEGYARLMADPAVLKTLWARPEPPSAQDVASALTHYADQWDVDGFGLWALRDATTNEFVGSGGLHYTDIEGQSLVEAAWALMPERWGEGLATEVAGTSVEMAFAALELDEIVAVTLPHNLASRRVMEKAQFVYDRDVEHAGLPHVLYLRRRGRC